MAIEVQPAVLPHLTVDNAAAAIDFYVKAFDAVEHGRVPGPDGKLIHASLGINGSSIMLNDDFPEMSGGKSMTPKALVYYRKAELSLKRGDLRGAVLQLKLAIAADPASVFLRTALAEVELEVRKGP